MRSRVLAALALSSSIAFALPLGAQTSKRSTSRAPAGREASDLRMRETGIQGEQQRPDVLFVIPTGRGGPIVSPRLRDYSYDIQEPVVKPWLEAESRIAHSSVTRERSDVPDWKEAVQAAAKMPAPAAPVPMPEMRSSGPRVNEPGIPSEALPGPRVSEPGIPREALQLPPR